MSGYPPSGYGSAPYGAPGGYPAQPYAPSPYGAPQTSSPYGAPPSSAPYGAPPSSAPYGAPTPYGAPPASAPYGAAAPYGAPSAPYAQGEKPPKGDKPPKQQGDAYGAGHGGGYPSPFAALVPSQFPPGTDPNLVAGFRAADQDGSGVIDDKELQRALSAYSQTFSMRTVHLLMYLFTNSNSRKIGPKEFTSVFYSLQNWRAIFERFDRDRSGKIDATELREALLSLGYSASPVILDLLISKFDKTGSANKAIEYDNFIECCLTVKGLTEKFKEKDTMFNGSASFTYETFMLTVLPFLIA